MLIRSLQRMGADFLTLDEESVADQVQLRWQVTDRGVAGQLRVGGVVVDLREIHSVYHRFVDVEMLPEPGRSAEVVSQTRSILHSLMNLFDVLPARMVNRRRPMMSNNSKPYQALLIRQAGFAVPDTLITNNPQSLMEFASSGGPLIFKSVSSVRSIVTTLDPEAAARIESLRYLPTQFQRRIEGFNVRVHVIGRRLFATQVLTPATDYRYAGQQGAWAEFRPFELTAELRKRCLHLARLCGLAFSGIDLMVSRDQVYCLEVNPSPAYSYYQDATGQPISDALAEYLANTGRPVVPAESAHPRRTMPDNLTTKQEVNHVGGDS